MQTDTHTDRECVAEGSERNTRLRYGEVEGRWRTKGSRRKGVPVPYSAHLPSGQDNLEGGNCSARHETILYVGERQGRQGEEEGEGGHGNTGQGGKVQMVFSIMYKATLGILEVGSEGSTR